MKCEIFKAVLPDALNQQIKEFFNEDPRRELRDVRLAYGRGTDGGMTVAAVLYDEVHRGGVPIPDHHDDQALARMDRTRNELVGAEVGRA